MDNRIPVDKAMVQTERERWTNDSVRRVVWYDFDRLCSVLLCWLHRHDDPLFSVQHEQGCLRIVKWPDNISRHHICMRLLSNDAIKHQTYAL